MILFIFEGSQREPTLFKSIRNLFFSHGEKEGVVCSFGNNIYELYRQLKSLDFYNNNDVDIVAVMKENLAARQDNTLEGVILSDFSEVFLFFDYDIHHSLGDIDQLNKELLELLNYFDDETSKGKLYISYPMIESLRYTKTLPDTNFWTYTIPLSECNKFKTIVQQFSSYGNYGFISAADNRRKETVTNWMHLKHQHILKANYMCNGKLETPCNKSDISQHNIFKAELNKYAIPDYRVAILNAFPLFLYEYFK